MECNENFRKFYENISLKTTRHERIKSTVEGLVEFIKEDTTSNGDEDGLGDVYSGYFIQGSYRMGTAIRPAEDDQEYDVDVVVVFSLRKEDGALPSSKGVLEWLKKRLGKSGNYKSKLELKNRCVRINLKGEFHLDVVPVVPTIEDDGQYELPDKEGGWGRTDPDGYVTWFEEQHTASGDKLQRIVKYMKWWRNQHGKCDEMDLKSVVLTKLLGDFCRKGDSDAEALVETMESLNDWLANLQAKPKVQHPTLDTDLAKKWTNTAFLVFKNAFGEATKMARCAFEATSKKKSVDLWQELFGDEFPRLDGDEDENDEDDGDKGGYIVPDRPGKKKNREYA